MLRFFHSKAKLIIVANIIAAAQIYPWAAVAQPVPESKWTLENKLSVKTLNINGVRDEAQDAAAQRETAEFLLREGDYTLALKHLRNSARQLLQSSESSLDERARSVRYAEAETLLQKGQIAGCTHCLESALQKELDEDKQLELKGRKKTLDGQNLDRELESDKEFERRYLRLERDTKYDISRALLYRSRLLYWRGKSGDAERLSSMAVRLENHVDRKRVASHNQASMHSAFMFNRAISEWGVGSTSSLSDAHFSFVNDHGKLAEERVLILNGITSFSAGDLDTAEKCFTRAAQLNDFLANEDGPSMLMELLTEPREEGLIARMFLAESQFRQGKYATAYDSFNQVFEASRRLVEGKRDGLFYLALTSASREGIYKSVLAWLAGKNDPELNGARSPSIALSDLQECSYMKRHKESQRDHANRFISEAMSAEQDSDEVGEKLAMACYHVGYQYKVLGQQSRARFLFSSSAALLSRYAPDKKALLAMVLYDLAESYSWTENFDVASMLFAKCVEARREIGPQSNSYAMALAALGRAYMADGQSLKATKCLTEALSLLFEEERRKRSRIFEIAHKTDPGATISGGTVTHGGSAAYGAAVGNGDLSAANKVIHTGVASGTILAMDSSGPRCDQNMSFSCGDQCLLPNQMEKFSSERQAADPTSLTTIDDIWQVLADAYNRGKYYDESKTVSQALLRIRQDSPLTSRQQRLDSIWQLAYICSVSYKPKEAAELFQTMIEEYGLKGGRPVADWYFTHGILEDTLGSPPQAVKDFRNAIAQYKTHLGRLDQIKDKEQIEQIGWLIDDLKYELKAKQRCPESSGDYLKAYPCHHWSRSRFPLKVCIDKSKEHGFGPDLSRRFQDAIRKWFETPGLNFAFTFVDDRETADVYFERVSNYDLIPYGSGGGAIAAFTGKKGDEEIDRVHLRIYAAKYDSDDLSDYAVQHLCTLALHEFGHALGLGHSPSGGDIMYWKSAMKDLSPRDRATLLKLYGCR